MAQFLYFVESSRVSTEDSRRLAYAFHKTPTRRQVLGEGPGGKPGWMLSCGEPSSVGFFKDRQTWRQVPKTDGRLWVGYENLPTPSDLAKPTQLGGQRITLGNDTEWLVPVARSLAVTESDARWVTTLPRSLDINEDGEWIYGDVVSQYVGLYRIAERWWDARKSAGAAAACEIDPQQLVDMSVDVLAVNYHVGRIELAMMGAMLNDSNEKILDVAIDWDALLEYVEQQSDKGDEEKKRADLAEGGSNITDGAAA